MVLDLPPYSYRAPLVPYTRPQMGPASLFFRPRARNPRLLRIIGRHLAPPMGYPCHCLPFHLMALS
jgi:hypothetical protein